MVDQKSDVSEFGAITQALHAAGAGDEVAREKLAELVYEDLRRTAVYLMRGDQHRTLQPTALLNEAFVQLLGSEHIKNAPCRAYFFSAASTAMTRILVDAARRRNAAKRGGTKERVPLEDALASYEAKGIDIIALEEALDKLERLASRQSRIVRLRFFLEFSVKEVAELLDVSVSTVEQDWRAARAFLRSEMGAHD